MGQVDRLLLYFQLNQLDQVVRTTLSYLCFLENHHYQWIQFDPVYQWVL